MNCLRTDCSAHEHGGRSVRPDQMSSRFRRGTQRPLMFLNEGCGHLDEVPRRHGRTIAANAKA